jgi:hypothetical protein
MRRLAVMAALPPGSSRNGAGKGDITNEFAAAADADADRFTMLWLSWQAPDDIYDI